VESALEPISNGQQELGLGLGLVAALHQFGAGDQRLLMFGRDLLDLFEFLEKGFVLLLDHIFNLLPEV